MLPIRSSSICTVFFDQTFLDQYQKNELSTSFGQLSSNEQKDIMNKNNKQVPNIVNIFLYNKKTINCCFVKNASNKTQNSLNINKVEDDVIVLSDGDTMVGKSTYFNSVQAGDFVADDDNIEFRNSIIQKTTLEVFNILISNLMDKMDFYVRVNDMGQWMYLNTPGILIYN